MTSDSKTDNGFKDRELRSGLLQRLAGLVGLYALELLAISTSLDTATLSNHGLIGFVSSWGSRILQSVLAFATILLTFGYLNDKSTFERIAGKLSITPVGWKLLVFHAVSMAGFALLSLRLFEGSSSDWMAVAWLAAGLSGIVSAGFAFLPPFVWWAMVPGWKLLWLTAGLAVMAVMVTGPLGQSLRIQAAGYTFGVVRILLWPFLTITSDPATRIIGTPHFEVAIDPTCSGLEGIGLILVFMTAWLWFFRRECRFPHALLAVPVGVTLMWLLNSVRIATLILIGNAGAPGIAAGGFHSQAGWIAFNCAAVAFMLAFRRIPWLRAGSPLETDGLSGIGQSEESPAFDWLTANPTACYLMPFLMILAAAMISRAVSSGFEWLYSLRFFAALAVLWLCRKQYARIDWRFGWLAAIIGPLVFVLWVGPGWVTGNHNGANVIGNGLARLTPAGRIGWLAFRVLAAVVTVPIAEELAFRGFLLRRFISADFEAVQPTAFTYTGLFLSSLSFGILHGDRWIAGTLAGLLYAFLFLRQGKLGDAVAAHAITNGLLAVWVLTRGQWYYW